MISPPKKSVICLTRDKSACHHQSNVPPQIAVCPVPWLGPPAFWDFPSTAVRLNYLRVVQPGLSCWKARDKMRCLFLHLLYATAIYCQDIQYEVSPLQFQDPVAVGSNRTTLSGLVGIAALPSSAFLTLPDAAQSTECPALHCKRKSLKNSKNTICCPFIRGRYGRPKCPKSCD